MKKVPLYKQTVEWSEDDGCFVGKCPDLMTGGVHGDDEEEVRTQLAMAVDDVISILLEDGEPLPEPSTS